jgi:uncharacterized repeat protein (TIGR03803 family)
VFETPADTVQPLTTEGAAEEMKDNQRKHWFSWAALLTLCGVAGTTSGSPTLSVLTSFRGANGDGPIGALAMDAAGNLYGSTEYGGTHNRGVLFRTNAITGGHTVLHSFSSQYASPMSGVVRGLDGRIYGSTSFGGSLGNNGTLFRYDPVASTTTHVAEFDGANGSWIKSPLVVDSDGTLLGTARGGGSGTWGTIFRYNPVTSHLTTLAAFNYANGGLPSSVIVDSSGVFYGGATRGGAQDLGVIYRMSTTGQLTAAARFNSITGWRPEGAVAISPSGILYGTTESGGQFGYGTFYAFDTSNNSLSVIHQFQYTASSGARPVGGVIIDGAGQVWGTTADGGEDGSGTIFRFDPATSQFTTVWSFNWDADGSDPQGPLQADALGNLYGVAGSGGPSGYGTVFKLSGAGFVPIPEPSTSMFLGSGCVLLLRRRKPAGQVPRP